MLAIYLIYRINLNSVNCYTKYAKNNRFLNTKNVNELKYNKQTYLIKNRCLFVWRLEPPHSIPGFNVKGFKKNQKYDFSLEFRKIPVKAFLAILTILENSYKIVQNRIKRA